VHATEPLSICAIGDLIMDVIVLPKAPLRPDGDTPASIQFCVGGQGATVAAWAAAMGARARLITARGSDFSGELGNAELISRGVEICGPVREGPGGVVVSVGDADGGRTMASDRGVATELSAADIEPAWVRSCDVLYVSGYCLLPETMSEAVIEAASLAPRVVVDLASAHDIELTGGDVFLERLTALAPDLAFATEPERAAIPDFATEWVIKLGARGARFPEGEFPAPAVRVVDATGAGDALAAGYLVGGPELAIEAAAKCISHVGGMPAESGTA
jgi:sugar/nucleoside kinase (ribokinase family)